MSATSTSALSSTLAGAFMAGQLVACTVTASDGKSGTDTDTGSVTIGNTAPVVSSVTLSPSTVYTNDTLTANVVSSDADGDSLSLSYAWYVDSVLKESGSSASLSGASYFNKGQAVYVTATANDGTTSTALTSSSITVSNTAPTAPVVAITPVDAESGDDLTCSVTTASTDVDGDALTYAFTWDLDGVDYASATDSATDSVVDGADVGGGETWTCEVVAGDGSGAIGPSGGAALTTADVLSACSDGTTDLGEDGWGRDDIAYCDFNAMPESGSITVSIAQTYCETGWHVCSGTEFMARNDSIVPGVDLIAKINDGESCWVVDDGGTTGGGHRINRDEVRSTLAGSCTGSKSSYTWGRQVTPGCYDGWGRCGVLCCQ